MNIPGFSGSIYERPGPEWSRSSGPVVLPPSLVLAPNDEDDVCSAILWATEARRALTPRGAGTGMPGGNVTSDAVLDFSGSSVWANIGPVDRVAGRVTVGPGAIAADVAAAAREVGLSFPALPSSADRCTVGGMVANNAAGARSLMYGPVVHRVAELRVIDWQGHPWDLERGGDGADPWTRAGRSAWAPTPQTLDAWPRIRKNSSGYALDRFHESGSGLDLVVGSEGTLGVVVEITLELAPAPTHSTTVLVGAPSSGELVAWSAFARKTGLVACEFLGPWLLEQTRLADDPTFGQVAHRAHSVLILEAEGSQAEVESAVAGIGVEAERRGCPFLVSGTEDESQAIWSIRKRASPTIAAAAANGFKSMQFIEDSVVPPGRLADYLSGLSEILNGVGFAAAVFGHAGDANVHVNPLVPVESPDWRPRVRTALDQTVGLVRELGGTLAGEHGDGRIRAPYLEAIWGPRFFEAFTRIKQALDPEGIFNPGVVVPLPDQDPLRGLHGS